MPAIQDLDAERTDFGTRLREAIDSWDPRRLRSWLTWRVEGRSLLTQLYCALRDEAQALLASI